MEFYLFLDVHWYDYHLAENFMQEYAEVLAFGVKMSPTFLRGKITFM